MDEENATTSRLRYEISTTSIRGPEKPRSLTLVKSIFIHGCGDGSAGASLAMALAGKPVHVFACSQSLAGMSQFEDVPNVRTLHVNPTSEADVEPMKELVTTRFKVRKPKTYTNSCSRRQEGVRGCTGRKGAGLWEGHTSNLEHLSQALEPFLIASRGISGFTMNWNRLMLRF